MFSESKRPVAAGMDSRISLREITPARQILLRNIPEFRAAKYDAFLSKLFATRHHDTAGTDNFNDLELGQHCFGRVDLARVALNHGDH